MAIITIHMRKNDGLEFFCIFTSGRFCLTPGSAGVALHFREAPGWSGRVHMYDKAQKNIYVFQVSRPYLGFFPNPT